MTNTEVGAVTGAPRMWLRIEGAAVAVVAIWLFSRGDGSWLFFAALILAPDASAVGYLASARVGAWTYNAAHSYVGPLLLGAYAVATGAGLGLVYMWVAHIGIDRALGFGLKHESGFRDTHFGRLGRA